MAVRAAMSDEFDISHWLESDERLAFRRPGVDTQVLARLHAGFWAQSAQLDLHGLRSDEAREAVQHFIEHCMHNGLRCVRVIHGKGHGSDQGQPVLKSKVWRWLVQRREVLAACEAAPHRGGEGAVVVLLANPKLRR